MGKSKASQLRRPFIGIDLGGTNMQIGAVDAQNNVIGRARYKTQAEKGKSFVLGKIVEGVKEACGEAGLQVSALGGLGIGAPGAINPDGGIVLEAVNLRWNNVPLAKILRERLRIPCFVENDVNAAIYGEWKLGAGRGGRDMLGVWVGTGIGGGLVLNNALYNGGFFTAGEIGHMPLVLGAPRGRRSVEQNCSRTAVVERLIALIRSNNPSVISKLTGGDYEQVKSKVIAQAYKQRDPLTLAVLKEAADLLAQCVGGVVTLLSLPKVILGGGLTEAVGEPWVKEVRAAVREVAFPDRCKAVEVVASELEDDAGLLGAALLARHAL